MNKFWKWTTNKAPDPEVAETRTLFLNGTIAEESWFDDDVTPALFKSELNGGAGDITVWINSPGGDCFAAAQIYNMLRDYAGRVTVKIDGLAASAASVIAMAGDEVLVSPVSMLMIHNPATIAMGDAGDMQKAIEMLDSVKNSIINAYVTKTGLSRGKLSKLMDEETWMDATQAVDLHFADRVMDRAYMADRKEEPEEAEEEDGEKEEKKTPSALFSRRRIAAAMNKKLMDYCKQSPAPEKTVQEDTRNVDDLMARLDLMKQFF